MRNINEYWIIVESLHFPVVGAAKDFTLEEEQRLKINLNILQNFIQHTSEDIVKNIIGDNSEHRLECVPHKIVENADDQFLYCLYSLQVLVDICKNTNFSSDATEDLVSERHKSLLISYIVDVATFGLQENLHPSFYREKSAVFKKRFRNEANFFRLEFLLESFSPLMFIKTLHVGKSLDDVMLCYMASIFSLLTAFDTSEYRLEQSDVGNFQAKLQTLWLKLPKKLYYRNLMLLFSSLRNTQRKRIHREMLLRLWSPGGFMALLFAMTESQSSDEQPLDEMVANLVAQPNFSIKAQHSLIKQILEFVEASQKNAEFSVHVGAGILSLRKLFDNKEENKELIIKWLGKKMEPLIKVEMTDIIAMEWMNVVDIFALLYHIFCISSVATLPIDLIAPYLPLILELYSQLKCYANQSNLSNHLQSLTLKILNNRSKEELKNIVKCVCLKAYPNEMFQLSSNIQVIENTLNVQELKLNLVYNEAVQQNKNHLSSLVSILKNSSYNILIYQHFLILLQLVPSQIMVSNSTKTNKTSMDLLVTEEEIYNKIFTDVSLMCGNKIEIIKALEALVEHQPLKTFINDNIEEILKALQDILTAYTENLGEDSSQTESNSIVLTILIILIREIIDNCSIHCEDLQTNLVRPLKSLEPHIHNENLRHQLSSLLKIITGEETFSGSKFGTSANHFEEARSLIESHESFLQVQGIEMMIKLLNKRDDYTLQNVHILTALALNTLKSPESYTFLNCVRLFVALVNVNETDILDLLSDEYLSEAKTMDYRLVVGEVILKTSIELGPLCYKYKNILLNTFMAGCRSPLDEFRFSAFSNLSQMCRQLTYQVHNYFQELLNLIDSELTTGKYLPAKRAAVMVLSELLAGMDNLFDYEEMLLPIYRLLKHLVVSKEHDEKTRIHASNGLRCLSEKCKELLQTGLQQHHKSTSLEKEIKVMGIHDKPRRTLKSHILEMN